MIDRRRNLGPRAGFTLLELMVVAAIMAALLTLTVPAVTGLLADSQLAQSQNILRSSLMSARYHAVEKKVVSGIRFQGDGHVVPILARNMDETYSLGDYTKAPIYDMTSIPATSPQMLPGPWRVTAGDVAPDSGSGNKWSTWYGTTSSGYAAATQWLSVEDGWFVFPVVLFAPSGRVVLGECKFSGDPHDPWYPTLDGAFGVATDEESNPWPIPAHPSLKYTNQITLVGWRSSGYKGGGSHTIPVEAPTVTAMPRLFNYTQFRGQQQISDNDALYAMITTAVDTKLDITTGMIIRDRAYDEVVGVN